MIAMILGFVPVRISYADLSQSGEVLPRKHLELLTRILQDVDTVLANAASRGVTLPVSGGWSDLAGLLVDGKVTASAVTVDDLLPHEDSSSGSDSDDD